MRRLVAVLAGIGAVLAAAAAPAPATAAPATARTCENVRLDGTLPAPPPGLRYQQEVTLGADCTVRTGPVVAVAAEATGHVHSSSEMYDCCGILMTALYSDSSWTTADGQVTGATVGTATAAHAEGGGNGWKLVTVGTTGGCPAACPSAAYQHHAEFSYKGFFDSSGTWYHNAHDTSVTLRGDGTYGCSFSVTLRHTFLGWHHVRGCSS